MLPAGTDAVVPFELAELDDQSFVEIVEAVAAGDAVEQQGAVGKIGAILAPAGMRLAVRHIGLLTNASRSDGPIALKAEPIEETQQSGVNPGLNRSWPTLGRRAGILRLELV